MAHILEDFASMLEASFNKDNANIVALYFAKLDIEAKATFHYVDGEERPACRVAIPLEVAREEETVALLEEECGIKIVAVLQMRNDALIVW